MAWPNKHGVIMASHPLPDMARAARTTLEADKTASGAVILSHQIHQFTSFPQLWVKLPKFGKCDKLELTSMGGRGEGCANCGKEG